MNTNKYGAIAAGHPAVTAAGAAILQAGGNAFDAAIGAMMASFVAESTCISAAGGGFLMARTANKKATLFDFFTQTPLQKRPESELDFYKVTLNFGDNTQDFHIGLGAAAVPGNIAGAFKVHEQLGKMPFAELAQPAIDLAKEGAIIDDFQAFLIQLLAPILLAEKTGRSVFAKANGDIKTKGDTLLIPNLADTLYVLSKEGMREFYEGEIAHRLVNDCKDKGGFLSLADLKNYQVLERTPLTMRYRKHELLTNPPPSAGGILMAFSLQLLADYELSLAHLGKPDYIELFAKIMTQTNEARYAGLDEHIYQPQILKQFLSSENIQLHRQKLASKVGSTTHISTADTAGNIASLTLSAGEGNAYFIPETGIMMNNMLGEEDLNPNGFHQWSCNKRISSMMSPSILLHPNGNCTALGSSGSNRIRTALMQVISQVVDMEMPLEEAINYPRIHAEGKELNIEWGFREEVRQAVKSNANKILWDKTSMYFGGVNAVVRTAKEQFFAAADARRFGTKAIL